MRNDQLSDHLDEEHAPHPDDLVREHGSPLHSDDRPGPDAVDLVTEAAALEAVFAADRLERVDAMRREALAEAARHGSRLVEVVERSLRLELASALRITEHAAGRMLDQAHALVHRYPSALACLREAQVTLRHTEVLVDELDRLAPEQRTRLLPRAVELAKVEPVGVFRRTLRRLVDTTLAATLEERHQDAVVRRRVILEPGSDGMGTLIAIAPHVELHAIYGRLTAIAKTHLAESPADAGPAGEAGDARRTLAQARADVLCDLLIDGTTDALPAAASGIRATVVVTVPALSLLDAPGSAEPPVVDGLGPIPLSRARELCGADAHWTRILTHPETGMVLSVGRDRYRPPPALRRLARWRSERCMAPGCLIPASRCEIDHQLAWEHGGLTSLQNISPLCKGHHTVKHHGNWNVVQLDGTGGALRWTSPTGRRYVVRPERPVPVFRPAAAESRAPAPPF